MMTGGDKREGGGRSKFPFEMFVNDVEIKFNAAIFVSLIILLSFDAAVPI